MDAVKTAHTSRARRIQSKYRVPAATMTQSNGGTRQCDRARAHAAAEGVQTARAPLLVCRISTFRSILLPESCPTSISGSQRPQPSSVHLTRTCGTAWHRGEATFPHKVSEPEVPSRTFNQVRRSDTSLRNAATLHVGVYGTRQPSAPSLARRPSAAKRPIAARCLPTVLTATAERRNARLKWLSGPNEAGSVWHGRVEGTQETLIV
jgi:hypothetical protein